MTDNGTGIDVEEISIKEFEETENHFNVREACTLQYNQRATEKVSGDGIVFSSDAVEQSVTLTLEAAKKALENATNEENMEKYGIPNKEIKIGITESQKPVTLRFLNEHEL